jgi:hypothetical protein
MGNHWGQLSVEMKVLMTVKNLVDYLEIMLVEMTGALLVDWMEMTRADLMGIQKVVTKDS